jgi:hypothetical protein
MPYIKQDARHIFESHINNLATDAENAGDLNYIITKMLHLYLKKKGLRYANCNEVIGALECCKLEMYRVLVGRYEDDKIIENSGVGIFPEYEEKIPQSQNVSWVRDKAKLQAQIEEASKPSY